MTGSWEAHYPHWGYICYWIFLFSRSKASNANIGIIANVVSLWKTLVLESIKLIASNGILIRGCSFNVFQATLLWS